MRLLVVTACLLPLAASFLFQRPALLHPPKSPSLLILNEIDIDKVTSAVTVPGEKVVRGPAPPPPEKKEAAPSLKLELPPTESLSSTVEPSPAPAEQPPAVAPVPPPTISSSTATAPPPVVVPPSAPDFGSLPVLPIAAGGLLAAFAAITFGMRGDVDEREASQQQTPTSSSAATSSATSSSSPLAIPYDAAARLAYDGWRSKYNKGGFDAAKYSKFKMNYEQMAVANVTAKKKARDGGGDAKLVELDENADQ